MCSFDLKLMMTGVVRWVFDIEGNRVHSITMGTGSVGLGFFVDLNLRDALLVIVSLARKNLVELELETCFILFRKNFVQVQVRWVVWSRV